MRKTIINTKEEQIDIPVANTSAHNWENRYEPLPIDCSNEDEGGSSDPAKNLLWFIKKAKEGNAYAQLLLYYLYTNGDEDIPQDHTEALKWLRRAADQKHPDAQSKLGWAYAMGIGVKKNLKKAVKWWKLAAEQGFVDSQYNLGLSHCRGDGIPQDYKEAVKWWKLAAEQGCAESQFALGLTYFNGDGVPQDYEEAVKWWKLAVKQNNLMALDCLVGLYEDGYIVPQPKEFGQILEWSKLLREQTAA